MLNESEFVCVHIMYHMQVQELGAEPILFPGFTMAVFDLPDGRTRDEWNTKVTPCSIITPLHCNSWPYYVDICMYAHIIGLSFLFH